MTSLSLQETSTYYLRNAKKILADVDPFFQLSKRAAAEKYGPSFAARATWSALQRFKVLLPDLPYIGGDENPLTTNLILGTAMLCLYQEMKALGKVLEETGQIIHETVLAISAQGREVMPDSRQVEKMIGVHRQADRFSKSFPYRFGWQTRFIEGNGKDFDWGVDYTSCGICTLFRQHEAEEFIPFVCFLDLPMYQARGIGLVRTQTLAQGAAKCDFRFNLRGEYSLEWVPGFFQTQS